MAGRVTAVAVVVLLLTGCWDDPVQVIEPDGESRSTTQGSPVPSGIFHGAEGFVAGNPMLNFAGGAPYNFGYYSDGPDPADGFYDSDRARIEIPHDSLLLANLQNFAFETWLRPSPSDVWQYGLVAVNSEQSFNEFGSNDFGYFLLEYWQHPKGAGPDYVNRVDFYWSVSSYHWSGWSTLYVYDYEVKAPSPDPETGAEMHVVAMHENDVIRLYVNGQLVGQLDISGDAGLNGTTGSGFRRNLMESPNWSGNLAKPLMIGGTRYVATDTTYLGLAGSIGESAFYRRALISSEVWQHYTQGTQAPPSQPDSTYDPYRDLVLSHGPAGYWRHRESWLHGLPSIDGEQVVDASGNGWHGSYRVHSNTPPACDSTVTVILAEYDSASLGIQPVCEDFATDGGTTNFSWAELNDHWRQGSGHEPWGMIKQELLAGLEATRSNYGDRGILLTSGYRCPHGNASIQGASPTSFHMHGRAADMYSAEHGREWKKKEFEELYMAALATSPTEIFPWTQYKDRHLHAAW